MNCRVKKPVCEGSVNDANGVSRAATALTCESTVTSIVEDWDLVLT